MGVAELPATATASPADIPALFARAWNDRDPDALASLFDEDAEFVNVSGLRWHDRESIRKALRGPAGGRRQQVEPGDRRDEGQAAVTRCRRGSRAT